MPEAGLEVAVRDRGARRLLAEFAAAPGETVVFVGPSGSGKTTLLRTIAGLHRPASGRIRCDGATWLDTAAGVALPPQRRRVGMVFQHYALLPHLSARDNVALALGHLPAAQRRRRAEALLERVHLGGKGGVRPGRLSGGEQQRVALARALAREPRVLLLDEPFSAVDQVTRRKLRLEMAEIVRGLAVPVVLVTHDLEEAHVLGTRLCVLHHGELLQAGAPELVRRRPRDARVARLLDLRNVFPATVEGHREADGVTVLRWAGGRLEAPLAPRYRPGEAVTWCIPPELVLLHRRDRPSRGEAENPCRGRVVEAQAIGGMVNVLIRTQPGDALVHMDLPPHVVRRNRVRAGDEVAFSLLGEAIHVMPPEPA
ncbi:ABC transporter ATP-binding protein [Inmirania thermothiophila]|uniref:Molybdate transport system ATP-binding protein n=1 Tax=Inmirania thermothiophila TaxID=1750597 RepID=A0A3N1XZG4_9GAMM|nr:ABC transporter ATP-binding protein [Inmirania thermothiophila]ROR31983.1 molybdate transport system ATP-binding protein [Inmirania thermothiophila]